MNHEEDEGAIPVIVVISVVRLTLWFEGARQPMVCLESREV